MAAEGDFAGLDGCQGGWVCARWDGGAGLTLARLDAVEDLFEAADAPLVAAIDIPIGLPERAGPGGRPPERLVRPRLGMRQSSVFSVPSRAAVEAGGALHLPEDERYRAACTVARATSDPPRAISKQCFHILPKILEVDRVLRSRPALDGRLFECHPEVSFWAMNGQREVPLPKKVKGRSFEDGLNFRRALLSAAGMPVERVTRETARRLKAGFDDVVDACACAWTARRIAQGIALSFPDPPERDGAGLRIAIHA